MLKKLVMNFLIYLLNIFMEIVIFMIDDTPAEKLLEYGGKKDFHDSWA